MGKRLEYNATLVEKRDLTPTLAIFRILPDRVPPAEATWFVGGQYVTLGLNTEGDAGPPCVRRAYSIASEPEERRWMEFYIRRVEKPESPAPLTHMLWVLEKGARLYVGDKVTGRFTLGHTVGDDDRRLKIFVAAGTGLAPFVSILKSSLVRGERDGVLREFVVLHGASREQDLGYREDLETVFRDVRRRYFPTVSRPEESPGWRGDRGRVETFFDGERLQDLERRLGLERGRLTPGNAVIYVCGLRGTISETVCRLVRRGFLPDDRKLRRLLEVPPDAPPSIFFEQYDTQPIIDPTEEALLERMRTCVQHAAGDRSVQQGR
jgi:ferredoxin--NADP+ reductase